jgi:putative spermidine/putrescine transport system permease protein
MPMLTSGATEKLGRVSHASPGRLPLRERWLTAVRGHHLATILLLALPLFVFMLSYGVPVLTSVSVSMWTMQGFEMERTWTLDHYRRVLENPLFLSTIAFTLKEVAIVAIGALIVAYPIAVFLAMFVPERWRMPILLALIIPFWTSYLIRMTAFVPLLGRPGLINSALVRLGILKEPSDIFLYSEPAQVGVMIAMYSLFMIAPIYFSILRIDPELLEAAADLRASPLRVFAEILWPLSLPGVVAGLLFVGIPVMGEFATPQVIGGLRHPMLGNSVMGAASMFQWPLASVYAVILTLLMLLLVALLLRVADLRRQL